MDHGRSLLRVVDMQSRISLLSLTVLTLMASVLFQAVSTPAADACSFAPPLLEVSPSSGLAPGQVVTVSGFGFIDVRFEEPPPSDEPQHSCIGVVTEPTELVEILWSQHGNDVLLGIVSGPDFATEVAVPDFADPGVATIYSPQSSVPFEVQIGDQCAPSAAAVGCVDPCEVDPWLAQCQPVCVAVFPPAPGCEPCALNPADPDCDDPCLALGCDPCVDQANGEWTCAPEPAHPCIDSAAADLVCPPDPCFGHRITGELSAGLPGVDVARLSFFECASAGPGEWRLAEQALERMRAAVERVTFSIFG